MPSFYAIARVLCHPVNEVKELTEDSSDMGFSPENDQHNELQATWPIVPQLFRRRSCEMMTTMSPCIQKAVTHLEMVQDLIDQWLMNSKMVGSEGSSGTSSNVGSRPLSHVTEFPSCEASETDLNEAEEIDSLLCVMPEEEDVPLSRSQSKHSDTESDTILANVGADDVIEEVVTLLARLEKDRQDTEFAYITECKHVRNLNHQVAEKARTRLVDLAYNIQREHEACVLDMNELQWHVNYSSRMKNRIMSKTATAEMFNTRLKEDIDFVEHHIPLVQEKVDLELSSMNKISKAQSETNKELEETLKRLAKTESKSKEAQEKATKERQHIERELAIVQVKLEEMQKEMVDRKNFTEWYEKEILDIRGKIDNLTQEDKVLEVDLDVVQDNEEKASLEVRRLENEIAEVNFEQDRLVNINLQLKTALCKKQKENDTELEILDEKVIIMDKTDRNLQRESKNLTLLIEDTLYKTEQCDKATVQNNKEIMRLEKEKKTFQGQLQESTKLYETILAANKRISQKLAVEIQKQKKVEETFQHTAETLKRQVKDESHTRAILSARISSDGNELEISRTETNKKTNQARVVVDEVETALSKVRDTVEKLRNMNEQSDKDIAATTGLIEIVHTREKTATEEHELMMSVKMPELQTLQMVELESKKQLKSIGFKIVQMTKHHEAMADSAVMMKKVQLNTTKEVRQLQIEREEKSLQSAAAIKAYNDLQTLLLNLKTRMTQAHQKHRVLIQARRAYYQEQLKVKGKKLAENKTLASHYRTLQNEYFDSKNTLLNMFEERIKMEKSTKNLRQLLSLQTRMHAALISYFKYRGLYNGSEVNKLGALSANNGNSIGTIKRDIDASMREMSLFLQSEVKRHAGADILPQIQARSGPGSIFTA